MTNRYRGCLCLPLIQVFYLAMTFTLTHDLENLTRSSNLDIAASERAEKLSGS